MTRRNNESFLAILLTVILGAGSSGCGGGSASSPPPLTVSMSPTTATVYEGLTQKFTATVNNDPTNQGITWAVSCGITTGCGSLSGMSSLNGAPVTYTAFSNTALNNPVTVTVTATLVADTTKSAAAAVTVPVLGVSLIPAMGLTHVNASIQIAAEKNSTDGLTWSLGPVKK